MLLFIEGYPYSLNDVVKDGLTVRDVLNDVVSVPVKEDKYSFGYVGYCYSKAAKDVVFFLPKVVLTGEINEESGDDTIFGASPPFRITPWMRTSGVTCCRRQSVPWNMSCAAFSALTPSQGAAEAWAALPWKVYR